MRSDNVSKTLMHTTSESSVVTVLNELDDNRLRIIDALNDPHREFLIAIKMPGFDYGDNSEAERNCIRLVSLISLALSLETHQSSQEQISDHVIALNRGVVDTNHAYIVLECTEAKAWELAEASKFSMQVAAEFGGSFQTFTIKQAFKFESVVNVVKQSYKNNEQRFLFSTAQKQALLRVRLNAVFDRFTHVRNSRGAELVKKRKIINDLYALHTLKRDNGVCASRIQFLKKNFNPRTMFITPLIFTYRHARVIAFMRYYFGEQIALYWNFLHTYTSWLFALSALGVLTTVGEWIIDDTARSFSIVYSIGVSLWSALFVESVIRSTTKLVHEWGMSDYENNESELSSFVSRSAERAYGFYEAGGAWVDLSQFASRAENDSILEFIPQRHVFAKSIFWRSVQKTLSGSVLCLLVIMVIISTLSLTFFRLFIVEFSAIYGGLMAGALNAVVIAILDAVYTIVALKLNHWENYRTSTEFENHLIVKIFCFQFINGYSSLFYIAFWKGQYSLFGRIDQCLDLDGNPAESCIDELSTHLTSLLIVRILIGNFVELGIPYLQGQIKFFRHYCFSSTINVKEDRGSMPEKQGALTLYTDDAVSGALYDYLELAIQFGLVTLFAPAFPLAPIIAFISNNIEGVVDGYKQLTATRKPFYQGAQDLGTWAWIFRFLSVCSVITNACLLLFTFDASREHSFFIVLGEHCVLLLQFVIATTINEVPARIRVQNERIKAIRKVEFEHAEYNRTADRHHQHECEYALNNDANSIHIDAVNT